MSKLSFIFVIFRIMLGCLYLVSGTEKLIQPIENFIFVIKAYDVLRDDLLEQLSAWMVAWIEFLIGGFLVLGLWSRLTLRGIALFSIVFIGMVAQAMIRHLPIDHCGCFGDLAHVPLHVIIILDSFILLLVAFLLKFEQHTTRFSLDSTFTPKQ